MSEDLTIASYKNCPTCGKFLATNRTGARKEAWLKRINESIARRKAAGIKLGQPLKYDRKEIVKLHLAGLRNKDISKRLGASKVTVSRIITDWKRKNNIETKTETKLKEKVCEKLLSPQQSCSVPTLPTQVK